MARLAGDATEVVKMIGAAQPDQQLDPEPPVNRMMSPPFWRAREEDYLKGEVHGIPLVKKFFKVMIWNRYLKAVRDLIFTRRLSSLVGSFT
jgi:hypothetical protein